MEKILDMASMTLNKNSVPGEFYEYLAVLFSDY